MKKMTKPKRIKIPTSTQESIFSKNLNVCCVCKERGVGTNLHHIDGNPANNNEDNIALLCVQEHDHHHRPDSYDKSKHGDVPSDKIKELKIEWEQTVMECKTECPKILAVLNVYGSNEKVDSVRLLIQNIDMKVIYERDYYLLMGPPDQWIDNILDEVMWLGENVQLTIINKPLEIEYCNCGKGSTALSNVLDSNVATHLTASDWKNESVGSIYINPTTPSLALAVSYLNENIFSAHLHKCNGYLHFVCDNFEERTPIKRNPSIRTQATEIIQKVVDTWEPGRLFIGTGDDNNPTITDKFNLPIIWEK